MSPVLFHCPFYRFKARRKCTTGGPDKADASGRYTPIVLCGAQDEKQDALVIEFEKTRDILAGVLGKTKHAFLAGFAAETQNLREGYARDKLSAARISI